MNIRSLCVKPEFSPEKIVGDLPRNQRFGSMAAFTLVELLVVIAIISIIAGLLLPALSAAKTAARSIACLNNNKQVYLSLGGYMEDWGGALPGYADVLNLTPGGFSGFYWQWFTRADYGGTYMGDFNYHRSETVNRGKGTILDCPGINPGMIMSQGGVTSNQSDYGLDRHPCRPSGNNDIMSKTVNVYRTAMRDKPSREAFVLCAGVGLFMKWSWFNQDRISAHNNGSGIMFYDGHCAIVKAAEIDQYINSNDGFWNE